MSRLTLLGAGKPLTAAYAGPFDGITFAALYGLKRFLTSYTGNLIRLRRNSDNAESDFGYVEVTGLLDTAAIATWDGGASNFLPTWYDQSGNGRNGTQTSASVQRNYVAGAVNGLPWIHRAAADCRLRFYPHFSNLTLTNFTLAAVVQYDNPGSATNGYILGSSNPGAAFWGYNNDAAGMKLGAYEFGGLKRPDVRGAPHVFSVVVDSGNAEFRIDGDLQGSPVSVSGTFGFSDLFGGVLGWTLYGACPFVAIIASPVSDADYNTIGNELASLYGITWNTVS